MKARNRLFAILVALLGLLLLIFFLPPVLSSLALRRLESETGPLKVERFQRVGIPADNPGSRLLAVAKRLDISPAEHELLRRATRPDLEMVRANRELIAALLAKNTGPLRDARSIGSGASSLNIDYRVWDARLPNLLQQVDLARLLFLEGELALADGDAEGVLDVARTLGRQAEVMQGEPLLVIQTLGLLPERLQLRLLQALIAAQLPAESSHWEGLLVANDLRDRYRETISLEAFNFLRAVDALVAKLGRPREGEKPGDEAVRNYVAAVSGRARGLMGSRALNRYRLYLEAFDHDYAWIADLKAKAKPGLFENPFNQLGPDYPEVPARYRAVNASRTLLRQCIAVSLEPGLCPSRAPDQTCVLRTPDGAELLRLFPQREPVPPQECVVPPPISPP